MRGIQRTEWTKLCGIASAVQVGEMQQFMWAPLIKECRAIPPADQRAPRHSAAGNLRLPREELRGSPAWHAGPEFNKNSRLKNIGHCPALGYYVAGWKPSNISWTWTSFSATVAGHHSMTKGPNSQLQFQQQVRSRVVRCAAGHQFTHLPLLSLSTLSSLCPVELRRVVFPGSVYTEHRGPESHG